MPAKPIESSVPKCPCGSDNVVECKYTCPRFYRCDDCGSRFLSDDYSSIVEAPFVEGEESGMSDICEDCGCSPRATEILQKLYDELCPSDSFGVPGSEFSTCIVCNAGGSPYVNFEHAEGCPVKAAEDFLYGIDSCDPQKS